MNLIHDVELTSLEGVAVSSDAGVVEMIGLPLSNENMKKYFKPEEYKTNCFIFLICC
jgi:hypothetical protein